MDDWEPYPCLPELVLEVDGRSKRSMYIAEKKNDVYSIFKVPNRPRLFLRNLRERRLVTNGSFVSPENRDEDSDQR